MVVRRKKDLIYNNLRDSIASGYYALGEKLPPELEFAAELDTSFITLRSALKRLEEEKLIQRIRGRGTFVVARPVLQKESSSLLLLYPEMEDKTISQNTFNRHLFSGVADVCAGMGDSLLAENFKSAFSSELIVRFRNGDFSGIIWDRPDLENPLIKELEESGVPQVVVNRVYPGIPSVCCDYMGAITLAVKSLRRFGHKYIGLCDFGFRHSVLCRRSEHFAKLLENDGISEAGKYVMNMYVANDEERMCEIKRCMHSPVPPTAVLVSHTYFKVFEQYLVENRISVPEQLSVVQWGEEDGYDRYSSHPYSILSDPRIEAGRRAADIIYRSLRGECIKDNYLNIAAEFILVDGCAAPRK